MENQAGHFQRQLVAFLPASELSSDVRRDGEGEASVTNAVIACGCPRLWIRRVLGKIGGSGKHFKEPTQPTKCTQHSCTLTMSGLVPSPGIRKTFQPTRVTNWSFMKLTVLLTRIFINQPGHHLSGLVCDRYKFVCKYAPTPLVPWGFSLMLYGFFLPLTKKPMWKNRVNPKMWWFTLGPAQRRGRWSRDPAAAESRAVFAVWEACMHLCFPDKERKGTSWMSTIAWGLGRKLRFFFLFPGKEKIH